MHTLERSSEELWGRRQRCDGLEPWSAEALERRRSRAKATATASPVRKILNWFREGSDSRCTRIRDPHSHALTRRSVRDGELLAAKRRDLRALAHQTRLVLTIPEWRQDL